MLLERVQPHSSVHFSLHIDWRVESFEEFVPLIGNHLSLGPAKDLISRESCGVKSRASFIHHTRRGDLSNRTSRDNAAGTRG